MFTLVYRRRWQRHFLTGDGNSGANDVGGTASGAGVPATDGVTDVSASSGRARGASSAAMVFRSDADDSASGDDDTSRPPAAHVSDTEGAAPPQEPSKYVTTGVGVVRHP